MEQSVLAASSACENRGFFLTYLSGTSFMFFLTQANRTRFFSVILESYGARIYSLKINSI